MEEIIEILNEPLEQEIQIQGESVGGGVSDYNSLFNKPKINDVELFGNKTSKDLGIEEISNTEIEEILKIFV